MNSSTLTPPRQPPRTIPPDDALRHTLHDEVHARPSPSIRLPALVVCVALDNASVSLAQELAQLQALNSNPALQLADLHTGFVRLQLGAASLRWERHTEFTRYTLILPLPAHSWPAADDASLNPDPMLPSGWLATLPGRTLAAIKLVMVEQDLSDAPTLVTQARAWFGENAVVASRIGNDGHSCAITDLRIDSTGFERMLVLCRPGTSITRAGRTSQRLLELEIYRLLALRGLPAAKQLMPLLKRCEAELATSVADLEHDDRADKDLLHDLSALAARLEQAAAEHGWRFAATGAYAALVQQRNAELREQPVAGTQMFGEFLTRRLSPAMATVEATSRRLDSLAARVERTTALLRTRVDIATEEQSHALLARLTRGQALQLRLQATVEGLSIAAISYYIVSLLLYGGKAAKAAGLHINPEIAAGASIPLVVWAVWRGSRRIHRSLVAAPSSPSPP